MSCETSKPTNTSCSPAHKWNGTVSKAARPVLSIALLGQILVSVCQTVCGADPLQGQGRGQTGLPFQYESGSIKHYAGA